MLKGDKLDVTLSDGTQQLNKALPSNGVIYVQDGGCPSTSSPLLQNYDEDQGCANVIVSGTYAKNLTIASQKDIVIGPPLRSPTDKRPSASNGDLKKNGDFVLGLIAEQFIRVEHSVSRPDPTDSDNYTNRVAPDGNGGFWRLLQQQLGELLGGVGEGEALAARSWARSP